MSADSAQNDSEKQNLSEHSRQDLRSLERKASSQCFPVSCVLRSKTNTTEAQIINFHFKGACLKLSKGADVLFQPDCTMDVFTGKKCIKKGLQFRICWNELTTSGHIGVEFIESIEKYFRAAERLEANPLYAPTVTSQDPVNPIRQVFFKLQNFSETGLLLVTSATNNYIFPGMSLSQCHLNIPGRKPISLDLYVESVRQGEKDTIHVGVSIKANNKLFKEAISEYAFSVSPTGQDKEDRLESHFIKNGWYSKRLKAGMSYKVIESALDYEKVLKLRYSSYGKVNKIKKDSSWHDMGEGLKNEGVVIGGYLGGQLLATAEIRLGNKMPLRTQKLLTHEQLKNIRLDTMIELNKLAVHPHAQGTDIVVGMMQRLHAMAMIHHLNILGVATDKLMPFYKKMGAVELGITTPHPVLSDEKLNLMIISYETHSAGANLNPYFWSQIYQVTHELMNDLGLSNSINHGFTRSLRYHVTKSLARLRKKKSESIERDTARKSSKSRKIFIDPRWTVQHYGVNVMLPYLLQAEETIGKHKVDSILNQVGIPSEYFFKQTNWVSVEFFNYFIAEYSKHADATQLQLEAGRKSMKKEILGLTYYFIKHFASMQLLLQEIISVANRFNKTRICEISNLGIQSGVLKVGLYDKAYLPQDPSACLNWVGCLEALIELSTGKKGTVKKTACCFNGDPACIYALTWVPQNSSLGRMLTWSLPIAGVVTTALLCIDSWMFGINIFAGLGLPIVGSLTGFAIFQTLKIDTLNTQFDKYHKESDERYADLERAKNLLEANYQEAVLLENLAKEIQKSTLLTGILNTTVSAICEKFGLSRSFIMLIDHKTKKLKTAAVSGTSEFSNILWEYEVDVSKARDNPMVLSSAFLASQSIFISDVEEHKFHLNNTSINLIDKLQSSGFIIVPIPSINGNWGVIVADKDQTSSRIDRRHLVLLQRVAQYLGIALDKKSQFEQEQTLRRIFQKYVPSRVLEGISETDEPKLGGQSRHIICMFVDIRGFTQLSNSYPPEVVLDILNSFFSLVQPIVATRGGLIDKFLGDGILITWGTTGISETYEQEAVGMAVDLLAQTETLSDKLAEMQLPRLKIGVGINSGPAIVGNVGSNDRMDFTAIGTTVNVASRLEALCKTYACSIVISEAIYEMLSDSQRDGWEAVEKVEIRGIANPIGIAHFGALKKIDKKAA
jgi:class 3 adenylate cyclase